MNEQSLQIDEPTEQTTEQAPYNRPGRWYVINSQSGYENKVKKNIEARTYSMNMENRIFETVIPTEDVTEIRNGKKVSVNKKIFPGYLLVRCILDDDSWYVIRTTPGVTGFLGAGNRPAHLTKKDIEKFLVSKKTETNEKQKMKTYFEINDTVQVKDGPFSDFFGHIIDVNESQMRLKVSVDIFGRETSVELEFAQVTKV